MTAHLFHATDHPSYEDLPDTLAEREQFPPRFHVPHFLDTATPQAWVCAVCWDETTTYQWPCTAAQENGREVFQVHESAWHPQDAVRLASAVLAAAGDTGHVVVSIQDSERTIRIRESIAAETMRDQVLQANATYYGKRLTEEIRKLPLLPDEPARAPLTADTDA